MNAHSLFSIQDASVTANIDFGLGNSSSPSIVTRPFSCPGTARQPGDRPADHPALWLRGTIICDKSHEERIERLFPFQENHLAMRSRHPACSTEPSDQPVLRRGCTYLVLPCHQRPPCSKPSETFLSPAFALPKPVRTLAVQRSNTVKSCRLEA